MTRPAVRGAGETSGPKLGTFGGVFTPSVLTILGLVLFLRVGFVTGNVGLLGMLAILGLSTAVSLLTTISLVAIATNLRVGGGGVYFLISRTLGPASGGAIGLVLYLAMSVSAAFYAIGLGEAIASVVGSSDPGLPRLVAAGTIVALVGVGWLGSDIATRFQYLVMVCLTVAVIAYLVGVADDLDFGLLADNARAPSDGGSFWVGFAIFFPAVTGFTQGVAMSGDLRTPSKSISTGTFGAIAVSTVVYLLLIVTIAMVVPLTLLREDTAIMRSLSITPWLIDVGVIAATLSSAIASIMGAPRTLQRLAADRLVRPLEPFAAATGDGNPRRGLLLTGAIALCTVALGDLDVVAPVISMFFLASYGMINFATYSEARAASTSFRPRFRFFDWRLSALGTAACLGVILAIDPFAGALAGLALFGLHRYLDRSVEEVRWADSTRGFHTSVVRSHLRQMGPAPDAGRDWRPCTVAFVPRDPDRRTRLATVASWFEGGAGFTTVARILPGTGPVARKKAGRVETALQREIAASGLAVYGRVIVSETLESGVAAMLQAHGIGALRANLALFSWYDYADPDRANAQSYGSMVHTGIRYGCNVAIVHAPEEAWERIPGPDHRATIAVWWSDDRSGQLLTLLAWMCTRSPTWAKATIEVCVAGDPTGSRAREEADRIAGIIDDARIPARVVMAEPDGFVARTQWADLVFAPVRIRQGSALGPGDVPIDEQIGELPVTVYAHAPAPVELDVQPDETEAAAVAIARDRAIALTTRADQLSEAASSLVVDAEVMRIEGEANGSVTTADLDRVRSEASRAQRTYLDARSRADEAWRQVREIDPTAGLRTDDSRDWPANSTPPRAPSNGNGDGARHEVAGSTGTNGSSIVARPDSGVGNGSGNGDRTGPPGADRGRRDRDQTRR